MYDEQQHHVQAQMELTLKKLNELIAERAKVVRGERPGHSLTMDYAWRIERCAEHIISMSKYSTAVL